VTNEDRESALQRMLDADPSNADTRLVLADLLEEMGEVVRAEGQRYQATKKKRPFEPDKERDDDPFNFFWYADYYGANTPIQDPESDLPSEVFAAIKTDDDQKTHKGFRTRQDAELALAEALAKLAAKCPNPKCKNGWITERYRNYQSDDYSESSSRCPDCAAVATK